MYTVYKSENWTIIIGLVRLPYIYKGYNISNSHVHNGGKGHAEYGIKQEGRDDFIPIIGKLHTFQNSKEQ